MLLTGSLIVVLISGAIAQAEISTAEQAAVFEAAGFKKAQGGQYIRCKEETPTASYSPGRIETADLNGDGLPEAWVRESSLFCYGNRSEYFVLLTKEAGRWRVLLEDVGIPSVPAAKHSGWPDIEVGGPGFSKFLVFRFNGKSYALHK